MTQRYSAYKDSGLEWIGEIPEYWEVTRISNLGSFYKGNGIKKDEVRLEGLPCIRYGEIYTTYDRIVPSVRSFIDEVTAEESVQGFKGDILFAGSGETIEDIGKAVLYIGDGPVYIGGDIIVLRLTQSANSLFLSYVVNSQYVQHQKSIVGKGEIVVHIYSKSIRDIRITLPPAIEQSQIVEFLDAKTSLIDKLVDVKQRRIELLKEKRAALINNAVTKGLDPNVKMKDSGIEWIGEIPGHWVVSKLGLFTVKIGAGSTPTGGSEVYSDAGIPFIRSQNVLFSGLSLDGVVFIDPAIHDSMSGSKVLFEDVLLNITGGSIGRCCVVDSSIEMNVNQHVSIIRTDNRLDRYFLNYILQSELGQTQVRYNLTGGNREGLTIEGIRNFDITLPAKVEQLQIVSYLNSETKKIDDLVALEQKKIDLLKEYRQALISETVTGKIKVTND